MVLLILLLFVGAASAGFDCTQREDGFYAEGCSSRYNRCVDGRTYVRKCASKTTRFDPRVNKCLYEHEVELCLEENPPVPPNVCDGKSDGDYKIGKCVRVFVRCSSGISVPQRCQPTLAFDGAKCEYIDECKKKLATAATNTSVSQPEGSPATTTATTHGQFNCDGKVDGLYEAGACQAKYILCSRGQKFEQHCPAKLVFNPVAKACDYRLSCIRKKGSPAVNDADIVDDDEKFSCPGNGAYPVTSCNIRYYLCGNNGSHVMSCPENLAFNPMNGQCDNYDNIPECRQGTSSVIFPSPNIKPVQKLPEKEDYCAEKDDGSFGSGCEMYFYMCIKKETYRLFCPVGLYFNQKTKACDFVENVVECHKSVPIEEVLPSAAIERALEEQTPTFDCKVRDDEFYDAQCSNTYFACVDGKSFTFKCPRNLIYEAKSQACNYRNLVQNCMLGTDETEDSEITQSSVAHLDTSESVCDELPDGLHAGDCSRQYFVCTGHATNSFFCPRGELFDRTIGICKNRKELPNCVVEL